MSIISGNPYLNAPFPCLPQAGYRIRVTDETGRCAWDSGEMQDGTATMVPYRGEPLRSFTVYRVLVACTLTDGAVYCGETDFGHTHFLLQKLLRAN